MNNKIESLGSEKYLTGIAPKPSKKATIEAQTATKLPSVYHVEIVPDVIVDIYAITNAYKTSHQIHHAIKKLAVAGKRKGGKDQRQDLREAINQIELEIKRLDLWEGK